MWGLKVTKKGARCARRQRRSRTTGGPRCGDQVGGKSAACGYVSGERDRGQGAEQLLQHHADSIRMIKAWTAVSGPNWHSSRTNVRLLCGWWRGFGVAGR